MYYCRGEACFAPTRNRMPLSGFKTQKHHRRSIRLREYDYSQPGSYFITVCTSDKAPLFGEIIEGEMVLNDFGKIVEKEILKTESFRNNIEIDKYVIMPNHVHLIIVIWPSRTGTARRAPTVERFGKPIRNSIPTIVRSLKSAITRQINILRHISNHSIWQRNYYEHIVRNEGELNKIRCYIINNPPKWEFDQENCNGLPIDEKREFWDKFLNEFSY
jgi:putative transposase